MLTTLLIAVSTVAIIAFMAPTTAAAITFGSTVKFACTTSASPTKMPMKRLTVP